jgi:hypothetical protein
VHTGSDSMTQSAEDAHYADRAREVYRERIAAKVAELPREELESMAVDVAEAIDSMAGTLAGMPHDMAQDRSWAWLYGIVLGWDDVAPSIAKRYEWHDYTRDRMVRYNVVVEKLINDDQDGVRSTS